MGKKLLPCLFANNYFTMYYLFSVNESERETFYVYVEKELFVEGTSFVDAFQLAFGLYFILNMKYPQKCSATLEMVQRYFLKIHPDSGSRCHKGDACKKKVLNLMKKLSDFN